LITTSNVSKLFNSNKSIGKRYFARVSVPKVPMQNGVPMDPWLFEKPPTPFKIDKSIRLHFNPSKQISPFGLLDKEQLVNINEADIGRFVVFEKEDIEKYFPEGTVGDYHKRDDILIHKGKRTGFLLREETIKIMERLNAARENKFAGPDDKYSLIYGLNGSGKSGVLNPIIPFARMQGWIVIVIRSGFELVSGYRIYESERVPGMYDNPGGAVPTIRGLLHCHKEQLSKLPLKGNFEINGFQRGENPTLATLLEFGLKKDRASCDVLFHFKNEISQVTEYPILVVADTVSAFAAPKADFYDPTYEHKFDVRFLHPNSLTLVQIWKDFAKHGIKNGHYVAATGHQNRDQRFFETKYTNFIEREKAAGIKGIFELPVLRKGEFDSWMSYLDHFKYFKREVPGGERDYVYHMCGGIGSDILKYSRVIVPYVEGIVEQ